MNKISRVFVLAEDACQQRFIYRFLREARFAPHQIRLRVAPKGRVSAEQWVREHYAEEVEEYRTRAAQTALVVLIDADNSEVAQRERQLQQALEEFRMAKRSGQERIAHLIPKRHIETWLLCLNGINVDEAENCKQHPKLNPDMQINPAAIAFFEGTRRNTNPPDHWVDSLLSAIPEIRRLD